jgi:hypothetical protein
MDRLHQFILIHKSTKYFGRCAFKHSAPVVFNVSCERKTCPVRSSFFPHTELSEMVTPVEVLSTFERTETPENGLNKGATALFFKISSLYMKVSTVKLLLFCTVLGYYIL